MNFVNGISVFINIFRNISAILKASVDALSHAATTGEIDSQDLENSMMSLAVHDQG